MTMVIDQGRQFGGMTYDHTATHNYMSSPNFTDPWQQQQANTAYSHLKQDSRSMPYSHALPPTSAPMSSTAYNTSTTGSMMAPQDGSRSSISYSEHQYSSPQPSTSPYVSQFPSINYAQSIHQQQAQQAQQRRLSEHANDSVRSNASFGELDASRGMLALSHQNLTDLTPRNLYEARARQNSDAYGFPAPVSGHSSISAASGRAGYPYYSSSGSVAESATDYSSAASEAGYDQSRTLPRPQAMVGSTAPPAPQTMMTQFSSKMSGNTQKKHKCKICEKRFTRPSSLQTHMYSHTGEKPFTCDVEGCGRNFSVVSNLRRHKKVHKGEGVSVSSASDTDDHDHEHDPLSV